MLPPVYTRTCRDHIKPRQSLHSLDRDSEGEEVSATTGERLMSLPSPSYEGTSASQVLLGLIRVTLRQ